MSVVIRISIDQTEPLTGTATTGDEAPVPFEGWMEFLGVVSELLGLPGAQAGGPAAREIARLGDRTSDRFDERED